MARDATKGAGDWRGSKSKRSPDGPKRTAATKWTQAAVASTMMLVVAGVALWLIWLFYRPKPKAYFVPFWVGTYQDRSGIPTVPWTRADRDAIIVGEKGALFSNTDKLEALDQRRDTMKKRLDGLRERSGDDAVVVYISAYAIVDADGKIRILASDSHPYEPKNQLLLSEVLGAIKDCKSTNKLLVLDIMRNMLDPRDLGATADGVGYLVPSELEDSKDPDLMVICACSPGEYALGSENLAGGRSAFGYFFERALNSPVADKNRDNVIDVQELQEYVVRNVEDWALQYRGVSQVPDLRGAVKHNFPLRAIQASSTSRGGLASLWPFGRSKSSATADEPPVDMPEVEEKTKDEPAEPAVSKEKTQGTDSSASDTKSSTKEKAKKSEKATTKEPDKGAGKAADKGTDKGEGERTSPSGRREYPDWLALGWDTYQGWWTSGEYRAAPRVFRRLGTMLLRAERRWRGGDNELEVKDELASELGVRKADMERATKDIPRPPIRSAGLAVALGRKLDVELKEAIEQALKKWRDINPKVPDGPKARTEIEKGLVNQLKGKKSIDFALALVRATENSQLDSQTVTFLDSIVDQSRTIFDDKDTPDQMVELRFLHQLAQRSEPAPPNDKDWWDVADTAWKTLFIAEQASFQPQALAWVRASLVDADARLHDAQVLLLTQPRGYASWKGQIAEAWKNTSTLYDSVLHQQEAIQDAQTTFTKTLTVLSFLIPYLEARTDPQLQQDWLEAATAARDVARRLDPPRELETTPDQIDAKITTLSGEADKLEGKCKRLLSALKKRVADCQSDTVAPDPKRTMDIEALLATPFPSTSDRRDLRDAERTLEARLKHSKGTSVASSDAGKSDLTRTRVKNRLERIIEFLKLSGSEGRAQKSIQSVSELAGTNEAKASWSSSEVDKVCRLMADIAQSDYHSFTDRLSSDKLMIGDIDLAGLLSPAYALRLADANADGGEDNPCTTARKRDSLEARNWLAAHYQHESLDLHDLADQDNFFESAARNCLPDRPFTGEAHPLIELRDAQRRPVTVQDPFKLTAEHRQGQVSLELRLENPGDANAANGVKTELSVIQSDDSRLKVTPVPDKLSLSNESRRVDVQFELAAGNGSRKAPPSEFFIRLKLENGRRYHARIPIKIVTGELDPSLVLSTDPVTLKKVAENKIRLRPIPGLPQPYYVFVENRTDKDVAVTVAVMAGGTIKARGGTKEIPIKVKTGSFERVKSFVDSPPLKKGEPLTKLVEPIQLQLLDATTGDLIKELRLPVDVLSPRDYMQYTSGEFIPYRPGFPNRLTVVINPLPALGDLPCPVELVLPEDRELFPAFKGQPTEGKRFDKLEAGGKPVDLTVRDIPLNPNVDDTKPTSFYLNVDGLEKADAIKRAFWFKTTFRADGNRQQVTLDEIPRVRFVATPDYRKDSPAKLLVEFAVDNPPPKAKLMFQLFSDEAGQQPVRNVVLNEKAKDERVGFDVDGGTGGLLFEASQRDWVQPFPIVGIQATCLLEARLLDATGKKVAEDRHTMELFDGRPQMMAIDAPTKIERGIPTIVVKASVSPPPRIKEVKFIVGTKNEVTEADFVKLEQEGKTFQGIQLDNEGQSWKATITVPENVTEKFLVTARFKPVAGITGLYSTEVTVFNPPTTAKDKAKAAAEASKPGSIEGTVTIAGRPQPEQTVILYFFDLKTNKYEFIDSKTTTDKGTYKFKDVPAKSYTVYCVEGVHQRKDAQPAIVKPGETITVDLKLLE